MKDGASEGIRTLDIHVGNVTLYQTELRSLPDERRHSTDSARDCKPPFQPPFHRQNSLVCAVAFSFTVASIGTPCEILADASPKGIGDDISQGEPP